MPGSSAGRGSYGSVFKARVRATGELVAIKVIPIGESDDIADIQKEIDMLKGCNHPNVVHYLVRLFNPLLSSPGPDIPPALLISAFMARRLRCADTSHLHR